MSQFSILPILPRALPSLGNGVTEVDRFAAPILDQIEKGLNHTAPGLGDALNDVRRALGPQANSMLLGAAVGLVLDGVDGAVSGAKLGAKF